MMSGKTIHLGCQVDHADLLQGAISIDCLKHEQLGLTTSNSGQDEAKDDYFKFCGVFSLRYLQRWSDDPWLSTLCTGYFVAAVTRTSPLRIE